MQVLAATPSRACAHGADIGKWRTNSCIMEPMTKFEKLWEQKRQEVLHERSKRIVKAAAEMEPIKLGKKDGGSWKAGLKDDAPFSQVVQAALPLVSGPFAAQVVRCFKGFAEGAFCKAECKREVDIRHLLQAALPESLRS